MFSYHVAGILFIALLLLDQTESHDSPNPRSLKISTALINAFDDDESVKKNIVVQFKEKPSQVLNLFDMTSLGVSDTMTEEAQIEMYNDYLLQMKQLKHETQEEVLMFLEAEAPQSHQSFWISNEIFVQGASKELCEALGSFQEVEAIQEEKRFSIHKPLEEGPVVDESRLVKQSENGVTADDFEWNIRKIRAHEASDGEKLKTCRVGIIDTGFRPSHEALNHVNVVAWFDAVNHKNKPYDDHGHGTHVAGVIAGSHGIGVAPHDTEFVGCKACSSSGTCSQAALTGCCQFMTEQRPNVISNSWGGPSGDRSYEDILKGWKATNIFTVFSAGNSGPSCGSISSPADSVNVVSVGATTSSDGLADFSSRGQCVNGMLGPKVSAPGHQIKSAWMSSDTAYKSLSGTSMACPHTTGLYALMYSRNPKITIDEATAAIITSCSTSGLQDPNQKCGGTSFSQFPNNMFGHGRIDCMNTLQFFSKTSESE